MKIILLLILIVIIIGCTNQSNITKELNAIESNNLISSNPDLIIVDIRTEEEYNSGHLKNAINMDYYSSDFEDMLNELDKDNEYLVYCQTGSRSSNAIKTMKKIGFNNIYHMYRGITEWNKLVYEIE